MSRRTSSDRGKPKTLPQWLQRMASNLGFSSSESLRETLERTISESQTEGEDPLPSQQRTMLLNLLGFGALRVSDVMVPRADIVGIAEDQPLSTLLQVFTKAGHSRIPVYRANLDDAFGMVHIRDVVAWATGQASLPGAAISGGYSPAHAFDLKRVDLSITLAQTKLVREVLLVPPSMPAVDLLAKMRAEQIHLALVVDEFGGIDGLVSIEDLVEEIVGDIADEHDTDEIPGIRVEGDVYIASARTPIETVESVLGVNLTSDVADDVDTLGGWVFVVAGRVPKRGSTIEHASGYSFEVVEASMRRVQKVKIIKTINDAVHSEDQDEPRLLPAPEAAAEAHNAAKPESKSGAGMRAA